MTTRDVMCLNKRRYDHKKEADAVAAKFPGSRAYLCAYGNHFHVTTKPWKQKYKGLRKGVSA